MKKGGDINNEKIRSGKTRGFGCRKSFLGFSTRRWNDFKNPRQEFLKDILDGDYIFC